MMSPSYETSIVMIVLLAIISFVFLQWSIFYIGNREVSLAFMSRFLIRRRGIFRLMPRKTSLFFFGRYPLHSVGCFLFSFVNVAAAVPLLVLTCTSDLPPYIGGNVMMYFALFSVAWEVGWISYIDITYALETRWLRKQYDAALRSKGRAPLPRTPGYIPGFVNDPAKFLLPEYHLRRAALDDGDAETTERLNQQFIRILQNYKKCILIETTKDGFRLTLRDVLSSDKKA